MKDTIYRQDAIDAINSHFGFNIEEEYGSAVQEVINGLPSVQSERPSGEWTTDDLSGLIYCSRCGNVAPVDTTGGRQYKSNFCQTCGADMRGEQMDMDVVTVFEALKVAHDKIEE